MFDIKNLKYNADGLIPAIITDAADGDVLMLGYMNAESLGITLEQKKVCFFSRSRQKLWLKGETSGNFLNVVSIKTDCDADTLLITAKPDGPTCHTGARSCFFEDISTVFKFFPPCINCFLQIAFFLLLFFGLCL